MNTYLTKNPHVQWCTWVGTLVLGLCCMFAYGQDFYWNPSSGTSADWSDATNWRIGSCSGTVATQYPGTGANQSAKFECANLIDCNIDLPTIEIDVLSIDGFDGDVLAPAFTTTDMKVGHIIDLRGPGVYRGSAAHTLHLQKNSNMEFTAASGAYDHGTSTFRISPNNNGGTAIATINCLNPLYKLRIDPVDNCEINALRDVNVVAGIYLENSHSINLNRNNSANQGDFYLQGNLYLINSYVGSVTPGDAWMILDGTSDQDIYGTVAEGEAIQGRMRVDKSSRKVFLHDYLTLQDEFELSNGIFNTRDNAGTLILEANVGAQSASNCSFVDGPVTMRASAGQTDLRFSIGQETTNGTVFHPLLLNNMSNVGQQTTFTATFFYNATGATSAAGYNTSSLGTGLQEVTDCMFWTVFETSGTSVEAQVGLGHNIPPCLSSSQNLLVANWDSGQWEDEGQSQTLNYTAPVCGTYPTGVDAVYSNAMQKDFGVYGLADGGIPCSTTQVRSIEYGGSNCSLASGCNACTGTGYTDILVFAAVDNVNNTTLYADPVTGATEYEFRFTKVSDGTEVSILQAAPQVNLGDFPCGDLDFSTDYDVQVRAFTNTGPCPYGSACTMTTQAASSTRLRDDYCNFYVIEDWFEILPAYPKKCSENFVINVWEPGSTNNHATITSFHPQLALATLPGGFKANNWGKVLAVSFTTQFANGYAEPTNICYIVTPLEHELTLTHPDCSADPVLKDGVVDLLVRGGLPPYTYSLTQGGTAVTATPTATTLVNTYWEFQLTYTGLAAGEDYLLEVEDALGGKVVREFSLGQDNAEYPEISGVPAVDQVHQQFPGPRYLPEHVLSPLPVLWLQPEFLGSNVTGSVAMMTELAEHWNYTIEVDLIEDPQSSLYANPNHFAGAWINLANTHPEFKTSAECFWGGVDATDGGGAIPGAYITATSLANSYYLNKPLATGGITFLGGGKSWSPAADETVLLYDGLAQSSYLSHMRQFLDFPLYLLNENGEMPPRLYSPSLVQQDPAVVVDYNNANSSNPQSWYQYLSNRKYAFRGMYGTGFANSNLFEHFTWYQVDGNNYAFHYWDESKGILSPIDNGLGSFTHSTSDIYVRRPSTWNKFSIGPDHGWKWFSRGRRFEVEAGDPICSPFVAAGWSTDPTENVRPSQWLGLLKAMAVGGAEFYYPGFFNLDATNLADPSNWAWQAAMPAYAQAVTSRYEQILQNGHFLLSTTDSPAGGIAGDQEFHSFTSVDGGFLTVIRQDANEMILSTTRQPSSNFGCSSPYTGVVNVNLGLAAKYNPASGNFENQGWAGNYSLNSRRQGSTYHLEVDDIAAAASVKIRQLDGWHEVGHPANWSKNFFFEAEVFDGASPSDNVNGTGNWTAEWYTEGVTITGSASNPDIDLTNFTSYVGFEQPTGFSGNATWNNHYGTNKAGPSLDYHFLYRSDGTTDPYAVWLKARSTGNNNTAAFIALLEVDEYGNEVYLYQDYMGCISGNTFQWYNDGNCCLAELPQLEENHEYILRVMARNRRLEIDQIALIHPDVNPVQDYGFNASANVGCQGTYDGRVYFEFTANCEGNAVQFYNRSSIIANCVDYTWTFEPGATSMETNPSYMFIGTATGGVVTVGDVFSVNLTANPTGCSFNPNRTSRNEDVTIGAKPIAEVLSGLKYCFGDAEIPVGGSSTSIGTGITYEWSPPTGLSDPTIHNPTFAYFQDVDLTLTVTNGDDCQASATESVIVSRIHFDLEVDCGLDRDNNEVRLHLENFGGDRYPSGSGSPTIIWTDGNGTVLSPSNFGMEVTVNPNINPPPFTVSVTDGAMCTVSEMVDIPTPVAAVSVPSLTCVGTEVQMIDQSTGVTECSKYEYIFSLNGVEQFRIYDPSPLVTFTTAGTWSYYFRVVNHSGASSSVTGTFSVQAGPTLAPITFPTPICGLDIVQLTTSVTSGTGSDFQWEPASIFFNDNGPSAEFIASETYADPLGERWVTVTFTDDLGCTATQEATLNILPGIWTNAGPDQAICNGTPVTLEGTAAGGTGTLQYRWKDPVLNVTNGAQVTTSHTGSWTFIASDAAGCIQEEVVEVTQVVNPPASTTLMVTDPDCDVNLFGKFDITLNGGTCDFTAYWDATFGTGIAPGICGSFPINGLLAGTHDVLIVDQENCAVTVTGTVANTAGNLTVTSVQHQLCATLGEATLTTTLTSPTITVFPQVNFTLTGNTLELEDLPAGTYWVQASNSTGCEVATVVISAEWTDVDIDLSDYACNGQIHYLVSSPHTVVNAVWTNVISQTTYTGLQGVPLGTYDVEVELSNGCFVDFQGIEVPEPNSQIEILAFPGYTGLCQTFQGHIAFQVFGAVEPLASFDITLGGIPVSGLNPELFISGLSSGVYTATVVDAEGCTKTIDVLVPYVCKNSNPPSVQELSGLESPLVEVFPNPFGKATTIRFQLPESGPATLQVFNLQGQLVADLYKGLASKSEPVEVEFDAGDLPAGMYMYRLHTDTGMNSGKMILQPLRE